MEHRVLGWMDEAVDPAEFPGYEVSMSTIDGAYNGLHTVSSLEEISDSQIEL